MRMVERVGRALAKEEGYAYNPFPYDARARAAIAAAREHFFAEAKESKFHDDRHAMFCAAEVCEEALVDAGDNS